MYDRILKGVMVAFYGQGVTIFFQFISVPLFISAWGLSEYGKWLTIFAIPMTLAMLDLGFFSVLGNKISKEIQDGNFKLASDIVNAITKWLLLLLFFIFIFIFILSEVLFYEFNVGIIITLVIYSFLMLWTNFIVNLFRANREFHIGSFLSNTSRLIESILVLVVLFNDGNMLKISLAYLFSRVVTSVCIFVFMTNRYKWYSFNIQSSSAIDKNDVRDSVNFALMPLAFMLNNQGVIFLLNTLLGSAQVAIFVTLRTYFRIINQFVTALTNASWQEINYIVNSGDEKHLSDLMNKIIKMVFYMTFSSGVVFYFSLDPILDVWTNGSITSSASESVLILSSVLLFSWWQPYHVFLSAVGEYRKHTRIYFALQIIMIFGAYILNVNIEQFLCMLLFVELSMLIFSRYIYIRGHYAV